ncbi:MAG: tRNA (N6-threonylcarbamoyladenosine(37)-N6)-methyltransferase TrmO [Candidatus Hydrogenedens sp.]|nr:tRNA (N6-threonylcarbamoyladenosine(37)-N6)-methyltransferase TrmO [Candidatus Hydrogenedens sp.]
MSIAFEPIGVFHCAERHPYDAARQPAAAQANDGHIALHPGRNYEQALQDLAGFERIWIVYVFDRNANWKPLVQPPRADRKVGVFACRAPYRPNPIGLSCVELRGVHGLRVEVGAHDLLDGTPVLDIKPYVPYADSFPDAASGWLDTLETERWTVDFSEAAGRAVDWLEGHGAGCIRAFLTQQLAERPCDAKRKRVRPLEGKRWEIAYRTWRAVFTLDETGRPITVESIASGYSEADLARADDPHGDKALHRLFRQEFD